MGGLVEALASIVTAVGVGIASALIPVVNAEVASAAAGLKMSIGLAIAVSIALAVGQTLGKMALFEAARKGARMRAAKRERDHTPKKPMPPWQQRLMKRLDGRWQSNGVVLLSAGLGVPPLAIVSIAAGARQSRRVDFAVCCLLGRSARFAAVAALPLLFVN
jgi:membrane protein YqaA with SNARE-associated domain